MKKENEAQVQQMEQAKLEADKAKMESEKEEKAADRQNNIDVALIYANNKADSDREKEQNANLRKAAEIEVKNKELDIKQNSENKKSEKSQ